MLPLPSNREEFLFGNIVAEPLRARPPSFEERLQCGTWQPTTIMEDMWADQTHKEPRHLLGRSNWSLSTQHGLPCDLFHEIGRCQRTCVLCSNAPPWQEQMTEKKKRLLNDTRCKQTPTRMVVWNRVTLDNQHRTMKNKCCTISHKARNRRPRKQMWFTSRHIKCWYFPPRKDRCKTAVLPTLEVQPLNKTHHTHSTLLPNHRRDGFVKTHVRSDNKFPNSCCGQNQQP